MKPAPFIVGVGRSGTTLLRMMLDAHPDLAIPPETQFIGRLIHDNGTNLCLDGFLNILITTQTWNDFGIDQLLFKQALEEIKPFDVGQALRCFYRNYAQRFGKSRWGEKTPFYNLFIRGIYELLPEARFIHIIRDGRDVALSYRGLWFGPGDDIEAHAKMWVDRILESRRQASFVGYYKEIKYEDLITNHRSILRELSCYLELDYSEKMEQYHRSCGNRLQELAHYLNGDGTIRISRERRISIFALTKQPPDRNRIGRWRIEMTETEQEAYERIAGPLLNELGYETKFSGERNSQKAFKI